MPQDEKGGLGRPVTLSARQLECLALIAAGETSASIARRLCLSRHTVDHYIGTACNRLGARSRAQAVAIAIARRIIEPPDTT